GAVNSGAIPNGAFYPFTNYKGNTFYIDFLGVVRVSETSGEYSVVHSNDVYDLLSPTALISTKDNLYAYMTKRFLGSTTESGIYKWNDETGEFELIRAFDPVETLFDYFVTDDAIYFWGHDQDATYDNIDQNNFGAIYRIKDATVEQQYRMLPKDRFAPFINRFWEQGSDQFIYSREAETPILVNRGSDGWNPINVSDSVENFFDNANFIIFNEGYQAFIQQLSGGFVEVNSEVQGTRLNGTENTPLPASGRASINNQLFVVMREERLKDEIWTLALDQNNPPQIDDQSFAIDENTEVGTAVSTITASDADGDPLTFSIDGGNVSDAFAIQATSGELTVNNVDALDFETTPIFTLDIRVSDGKEGRNATVIVQLNDLDHIANRAPVINPQRFAVDEVITDAEGTFLGMIEVSDPDGDVVALSVKSGNEDNIFTIDPAAGLIFVNKAQFLDFETKPFFELLMEAFDGELTSEAIITIDVNDVEEAPNDPPVINDQVFSVAENSLFNTEIGTIEATDPDLDPLSFSFTDNTTSEIFQLPSDGRLFVGDRASMDFETNPSFTFEVTASDGKLRSTATITVNLIDIDETNNEPPFVPDQTFEIAENSYNVSIGIVEALDDDGDDLVFSLSEPEILKGFRIHPLNGNLVASRLDNVLDFETNPQITVPVTVSDNNITSTGIITINLTDVEEPVNNPPVIADQQFTIDENSPNGTVVGNVIASDVDGDNLRFSVINELDYFPFSFGSGGEIRTTSNVTDFETQSEFIVEVEVSDGVLTSEAVVSIFLNDVAEEPNSPPVFNGQTFYIDENAPNRSIVGILSAEDAEEDQITFTNLVRDPDNTFFLYPNGILMLANKGAIDFSQQASYKLLVNISDGNSYLNEEITIIVNEVGEGGNRQPRINDQVFSVDENSANGTLVGTIDAADPDGDALTFAITDGNSASGFAIDAASGELTVAEQTVLDFETSPSFNLTVNVNDGEFDASAVITINLNDVDENETPTITDQVFSV
ncbi:MAG: cadherin repeat domain-containing protein, partial [Bacteroidota bacterium]